MKHNTFSLLVYMLIHSVKVKGFAMQDYFFFFSSFPTSTFAGHFRLDKISYFGGIVSNKIFSKFYFLTFKISFEFSVLRDLGMVSYFNAQYNL